MKSSNSALKLRAPLGAAETQNGGVALSSPFDEHRHRS
jgi:hypothetical protein